MKNMPKIILRSLIAFFLFSFFISGTVFAQNLEVDYPGLDAITGGEFPKLEQFISWLYKFALGSVGVVALVVIIYGGIRYISSAGNPAAQGDAKQWIQGAILGLILLLGSFLILNTINPDLTKLGVADPTISLGGQSVESLAACIRQGPSPAICGNGCSNSVKTFGFGEDPNCVYWTGTQIKDRCAYPTICVQVWLGPGTTDIHCCQP